jgi:hypothetical protein
MIIVRRVEKIATFTNETNLIVADVTSKETTLKMKMFMNQIDDFENVLNLKHSYEQKYVINDDLSLLILRFSFHSIDISSLLRLLMKNLTMIYSMMKNDTSS